MNQINRIRFERPDLSELKLKNTVVDMHFHTHYSDGINSIDTIADRARKMGIGVAITDHNDIRGAVEISKHKDILNIPGIEITSMEGTHILIYFYDVRSLRKFYSKDVNPFMGHKIMSSTSLKMEEIIQRARKFKTVIIFPHPYSAAYTGINNLNFSTDRLSQLYNEADGVEVINSENLNKWNLKCALLGFNLNKSITGGSDGHTLHQLGKVVSYAECRNSRRSFLDAIKNKQNKVIGKEIHLIRKLTSNSLKLKRTIPNTPNIMEKNIRYSYTLINTKSKSFRERVRQHINGRSRENEESIELRGTK
jgi:predicted metal-dependent phosphoesterase TrpH